MKIQKEQQKLSVLAGKAQEYLRTIKDNLENPGFESQISGWITVLDTWRRIWETQSEENPQPVKQERKPSSTPSFSLEKDDYLQEYREQLLRDLKKIKPNPVLSRAIDRVMESCLKKDHDISYLQFKADVMKLYADFLEIRIPNLKSL